MKNDTLRELFAHNDWARDKLMTLASELTDEQFDRPFEMGPGSLRETLRHLYGAERIWFERWQGARQPQFPRSRAITAMSDLWKAFRDLAAARNAYLDALGQADLPRPVTYADPEGETHTFPLDDLLLHVCNHGFHHRAQALNMLRHNGVKVPGRDELFRKCEGPTLELMPETVNALREMGFKVQEAPAPQPTFDLDTIRKYYRYGDWAFHRIASVASVLTDDRLDRRFEMGLGSLRKTLLHIRDAEQSWLDNWTKGSTPGFNQLPENTTVAELRGLFQQTAERRDAFVSELTSDDLQRPIIAQPAPGKKLQFRLGEAILQLCGHGTHHRAQALNMLRRLEAEVPTLDCVVWLGAGQLPVKQSE
jgi:uncharacterized damage-inducible protein DinB